MDQKDIQQIGGLLDERLEKTEKRFDEKLDKRLKETEKRIIEQVREVIEQNILPAIDAVDAKVDALDTKIDAVDAKVDAVDAKVDRLPDKSYLDDKLADIKGDIIIVLRKEDKKVNLLIELLRKRNILKDGDLELLREIQVFPAPPQV